MDGSVLVAYASKYGGTAEIAEKIGDALRQADVQADVVKAEAVKDISSYRAVVLGSGVYVGKWLKPGAKFLKRNERALAALPVWLFSSGPTGEGDAESLTKGWRFPKALQPIADRIGPREVALFHGVLEMDRLTSIHKKMITMVKGSLGEYRDWEAIATWAAGIAEELKGTATPA